MEFSESEKLLKEVWYCFKCALMCKSVCTTHSHTRKEQHSLHARITMMELARRGLRDLDDVSVRNQYHCTLCRLCQAWCATGQNFREIQKAFRADIVRFGKAPANVLEINERLITTKNPYGEPPEKRYHPESRFQKDSEIVLFSGCKVAYKPRTQNIATNIKDIMDTAKIRYTFLDDEWCCGGLAADLGLEETAKKEAEHNAEIINSVNAKTLVTLCPRCAYSFKFDYPQWDVKLNVPVLHYTEYLNQLLKQERVKLKKPLTGAKEMTYHDPCILGRGLEVYKAPREILGQVPRLELKEMNWNREKSLCCGAGAGYILTNPKEASEIGFRVVKEAIRTGAKTLVVACPECELNYVMPSEQSGIDLKNLAEIFRNAM